MAQPELPDGFEWPDLTRDWWAAWGADPRAAAATDTDWFFLLDAAVLHAAVWGSGDVSAVGQLRNHLQAWDARLVVLGKSVPVERKGTPLDELEQRRKARKSGASRPARASGGKRESR